MKFHGNPSTGSGMFKCGWTDRHDETIALLSFANAHLNRCSSNKLEIIAVSLAGCDDVYFGRRLQKSVMNPVPTSPEPMRYNTAIWSLHLSDENQMNSFTL